MKRRLFSSVLILFALLVQAQVHIQIGDPGTWTVQSALAPYVNQTVIFDSPIVVCSNAGSSGTITVGPWRVFEPENQGVRGSTEYSSALQINSSTVFGLTDVSGYHRCGEKVYNLKAKVNSTNSLSYISGEWRGNKRSDLEAGLPDLGDYRLLVCAMNLENYFMTWGSMGADSYEEHKVQRAKTSAALKKINADVYGLVELQQGNEAIAEIVSDLNNNLPARNYKYFSESASGTQQKVDFVYDANVVAPIETPVETNVELQNRKKMVCFRELATGEKFIYSINHFKAMSGPSSIRENEARAVLTLYNTYRQHPKIKEKDLLVMGDLNCYGKTAPILILTDAGLIDLHRAFHADSSYSYMFSGKASYIDHALCNESMYNQVTGMAAYHINSDENDYYTYDGRWSDRTMFRSSDHDPVLVGLKLDSTLVYDPTPKINSAEIFTKDAHSVIIRNAHVEGKKSFYAIYYASGMLRERKEITSVFQEVEIPTSPGIYILYIYFDGQVYQRKMIVR